MQYYWHFDAIHNLLFLALFACWCETHMPRKVPEIIAGHRRKEAALWAGLTEVPVIIRELDDDQSVIAMVDSNLQREKILPSEKAFKKYPSPCGFFLTRSGTNTPSFSILHRSSNSSWFLSTLNGCPSKLCSSSNYISTKPAPGSWFSNEHISFFFAIFYFLLCLWIKEKDTHLPEVLKTSVLSAFLYAIE